MVAELVSTYLIERAKRRTRQREELRKEKQWYHRRVPIFERHLLLLENCGLLLSCKSSDQMTFLIRRNHDIKITFSLARIQLHIAETSEKRMQIISVCQR